jgi:YidC/Oxa1 family membrane protein insertase
MNEEIMALYSKEGVNPLSGMTGCLPLLLQLPILWGFYNLLNTAIELRHAPFALWIVDLSKKDPYYVTPIVMGVTMVIQQVMTGSTIPDPTQRRMMMLMPIIFTWFFKDLPSGLVLYWLVNNILAIGQQYLINTQVSRATSIEKARAKG